MKWMPIAVGTIIQGTKSRGKLVQTMLPKKGGIKNQIQGQQTGPDF